MWWYQRSKQSPEKIEFILYHHRLSFFQQQQHLFKELMLATDSKLIWYVMRSKSLENKSSHWICSVEGSCPLNHPFQANVVAVEKFSQLCLVQNNIEEKKYNAEDHCKYGSAVMTHVGVLDPDLITIEAFWCHFNVKTIMTMRIILIDNLDDVDDLDSDQNQGNFDVGPMSRQLGLFWEFWLSSRMILMFLIQIRIEAILMSAQCQDNCDNEDYFDLQFGGMLMISIQIRIKAILMSVQCHAGVKSISRWQTDLPLNLSMAYLHLPTVMVSYPLQPINVGMGDPSEP